MKNQLEYKGYLGSVNFEDGQYWGSFLNYPNGHGIFEGSTLEELESDFRESIDDFIRVDELLANFQPIAIPQ